MTTATRTLYLSRLTPDMRNRRARALISEPRKLYGILLEAFMDGAINHHDGQGNRGERGLLFRIEPAMPSRPALVLVQSSESPDWDRLETRGEGILLPGSPPETKAISPSIESGQILRFRLRANPTKSEPSPPATGSGKRDRGKVMALLTEEDQVAWLQRKLNGAATLGEIRIIDAGPSRGKPLKKDSVIIRSVLFEGIIRVENPTSLLQMMASGIGRGRSHGHGLLSVGPA